MLVKPEDRQSKTSSHSYSESRLVKSLRSKVLLALIAMPAGFALSFWGLSQFFDLGLPGFLLFLIAYLFVAYVVSMRVSLMAGSAVNNILQLLADFTHEISSPLSSLQGSLVSLRRSGSDAPGRVVMDAMDVSCRRLVGLNQDLRVISTWGAPIKQRELSVVALGKCAQLALAEVSQAFESKGLKLRIDEKEPIAVIGDALAVRRVFLNLFENSIKYSSEGTRLELLIEAQGAGALVAYRDYGPGVPEQLLVRIFDRLYRIAPEEFPTVDGTGLGLAIVREIVDSHGGSITAHGLQPSGLEFRIYLPKVPAQHPFAALLGQQE